MRNFTQWSKPLNKKINREINKEINKETSQHPSNANTLSIGVLLSSFCLFPSLSDAHGQIQFNDIATDPSYGLAYERTKSPRDSLFDAIKARGTIEMADIVFAPTQPRGFPGVVIFDYDSDKDLDIYVTNGPGKDNSLFQNQLTQSGTSTFSDVAMSAGIGAHLQDSNGACAGDIDNDGDDDLLVLGACESNRLFLNNGDGTFTDISDKSGIASPGSCSSSCTMGDIDNDGLLDIAVANTTVTWDHILAMAVEPFGFNQHNELYRNTGEGVFEDVSETSGIRDTKGFGPGLDGSPTLTWSISLLDYDQDGDIDLIQGDDQASILPAIAGGVDRGFIQVFANDGSGQFTNKTIEVGLNHQGQWMGLSFGDLNCDSRIDIFGSNFGDYTGQLLPTPAPLGNSTSRWFTQNADGSFTNYDVSQTGASVFGWGTAISDYDNDGDPDIIYHGGMDALIYADASNPGVILSNNNCSAQFTYTPQANSNTDHQRRAAHGFAQGDLNNDGFIDFVSVSNFDISASTPLLPYPILYGDPMDIAKFTFTFAPNGDGTFTDTGIEYPNGSLSVELNSADNNNHWLKVNLLGTKGLTKKGAVNRNGTGATVIFTPDHGSPIAIPIIAGSSTASQHSREAIFGLGAGETGTLDILWPGGVRNRVYDVEHNETLLVPEIPCSYDAAWPSFKKYKKCVRASLKQLSKAHIINHRQKRQLKSSAYKAYFDIHEQDHHHDDHEEDKEDADEKHS